MNIEYPIFLAGMGSKGRATPPELVAAVSEADGMLKRRRPAREIMMFMVHEAEGVLDRLESVRKPR